MKLEARHSWPLRLEMTVLGQMLGLCWAKRNTTFHHPNNRKHLNFNEYKLKPSTNAGPAPEESITGNFNGTSRIIFILFALLATAIFSAGPAVADSDLLRIGEVDPLTGKLAKHGQEIHEGILYAVEETNSAGGIGGRKVELCSRDDQSQPEIAINQTEDLLFREQVVGLVGGYVDSLVGPISELAGKHHIPYVASASLQKGLTLGRKNPYFFRVANLDGIVQPLCGFLVQDMKPERAAILFASTPGSTEFAQQVRSCLLDAGIAIPIFEKFRPGSPDFSAFLLKVRKSNSDVLISGGFFADHLVLVRQLRDQNVHLKAYIGPWGVAYPSFIEAMGEASDGLFGMCAWNPGISIAGTEKQSSEFVQGFIARFGKPPNTTTMHGYTSAKALLEALSRVHASGKDLSGDNIGAELRRLDLLLPMEHLQFDNNGDPKHYQQVVVQIEKEKMLAVYPAKRKTEEIAEPSSQ